MRINTFVVLLLVFLIAASCLNEKVVKDDFVIRFEDDFENGEKIKDFWHKEFNDSTRGTIVKDPYDMKNKVIEIKIDLDDYHSGGKRSEMVVYPKDSIGHVTQYSFRFLLPESFFALETKKSWIMIHQWHDFPSPGYTWATHKRKTAPPIQLYIQHLPNGDYWLYFVMGLKTGYINEKRSFRYNKKLLPNKWYNYSCEILWGVYSNKAYAKPKINDEYFSLKKPSGVYKTIEIIKSRNMYNSIPNSFKLGLYWDGSQEHNREIYFDDIIIKSKMASQCTQ